MSTKEKSASDVVSPTDTTDNTGVSDVIRQLTPEAQKAVDRYLLKMLGMYSVVLTTIAAIVGYNVMESIKSNAHSVAQTEARLATDKALDDYSDRFDALEEILKESTKRAIDAAADADSALARATKAEETLAAEVAILRDRIDATNREIDNLELRAITNAQTTSEAVKRLQREINESQEAISKARQVAASIAEQTSDIVDALLKDDDFKAAITGNALRSGLETIGITVNDHSVSFSGALAVAGSLTSAGLEVVEPQSDMPRVRILGGDYGGNILLLNATGNSVAKLSATTPGRDGQLVLYDNSGKMLIQAVADDNDTQLKLRDGGGDHAARVMMRMRKDSNGNKTGLLKTFGPNEQSWFDSDKYK